MKIDLKEGKMPVKVLLVDDHPIVRQGLRNLLHTEPAFTVVGEAGDGIEGLDLIHRLKPDVLIVDLMMPGLNGLDIIKQAIKQWPRLRIVVLSMQSADSYVVEALNCGASGYVLKETGPSEIIQAIHVVVGGERYLSPKLSQRLIDSSAGKKGITDPYDTLTNREREILHLIVEGLTSPRIAKKLFLSPRTVELHRSRIMKKLDLHNQTDIFRYALERGILPSDR
jgi:two-component system, NarL family, response regulator NreC